MSLLHLARTALAMNPRAAAGKAARMAKRMIANRLIGRLVRRQNTYPSAPGPLTHLLAPLAPALLAAHAETWRAQAAEARAHRFDLLGSGPVVVNRGAAYAGFGKWKYGGARPLPKNWRQALAAEVWPGNRMAVTALLAMIDDPAYRPIDWHADFRSGYRWPVRVWGASTAYAHKPGVDVKVPWELARLQHLPWLALAHAAQPDPAWPREFRNQTLDFLAANPPGWGVNWACAMDVAIRAANLVLAWDLFRAHGHAFDEAFEAELGGALLAHGRHVVHFLEWDEAHRGNHYLANLAGLAFIAAALPSTAETDLWLAFAAQQLDAEILRQFGPDGANFEASTAYHRLSAEMALYAVALIQTLPAERRKAWLAADPALWRRRPAMVKPAWPAFGDETLARLARAIRFAQDVTKPSGEMVQVGDNDSGRFFKLLPGSELDPRHLADPVIPAPTLPAVEPARTLDRQLPEQIATQIHRVVIAPADPTALDGLDAIAYPDFGLFIWRGARAFVSVRCGPIGGNGLGAHAHNDQLAVEIEIDGVPYARDPGTFVYTADLAARNRYRSALAHFVPRQGAAETARLDLGPFRLEDRAQAQAYRFLAGEFVGSHQGFGVPVFRRVLVAGGAVVIEDCTGGPVIGRDTIIREDRVETPAELARLWDLDLPFSPGYGRIA